MIWKASRSPVTTMTGTSSLRARSAIVAITSSASKPVDGDVAIAERVDQRLEVRPLLLEQVRARAARGLVVRRRPPCAPTSPASHTTIVGFGPYSVSSFTSIDAKPKIVFVGKPVDVAIDSGRAKKAR